jgi:hypothetical protein
VSTRRKGQRMLICLFGLAALASCGPTPMNQFGFATILHIPVHVVALSAPSKWKVHCPNGPNHCQASYEVRVTNLSTTAANFAQCYLALFDAASRRLLTTGAELTGPPGGIYVSAGSTKVSSAITPLTLEPSLLQRSVRSPMTCQAWDWHGHPPV